MRPASDRRTRGAEPVNSSRFSGVQRSLRVLPVLSVFGLGLILSGCGSLFGSDTPDTSSPLGTVVGPERNKQGLTGVGRSSEAAAIEAIAGGFVVADEPQAALIARGVLEDGGNAVDAATALYFALAVTQPQSAGLGGGGICLATNSQNRKTESIEFLPRLASAGGPVAVPGNLRGFALLHARHGQMSWSRLVAPAERMAATGTPVSRAMAMGLAPHASLIRANPQLAANLTGQTGAPLSERDVVRQIGLATTLGQVRSQGVNAFYTGDGARLLADGIRDAGGNVSVDDLKNYRPVLSETEVVNVTGVELHLPSKSTGAGAFASTLWQALQKVPAGDSAAAARVANETAISLGASTGLSDASGSTGFAVVSARGDAVACAVTLNGAFGAARVVHGSDIILATSPDDRAKGLASAFLAPALVTGLNSSTMIFAGASGGSPAATAGVQQTMRQALGGDGKTIAAALSAATPGSAALVNAIVCPAGLPLGFEKCEFAVDPDGAGLGVEAVGR